MMNLECKICNESDQTELYCHRCANNLVFTINEVFRHIEVPEHIIRTILANNECWIPLNNLGNKLPELGKRVLAHREQIIDEVLKVLHCKAMVLEGAS